MAYAERADDLLIRTGIMFRSLVVVPYGRMQYVDVNAGPLARRFGIASVQLHTASPGDERVDRRACRRTRPRACATGWPRAARPGWRGCDRRHARHPARPTRPRRADRRRTSPAGAGCTRSPRRSRAGRSWSRCWPSPGSRRATNLRQAIDAPASGRRSLLLLGGILLIGLIGFGYSAVAWRVTRFAVDRRGRPPAHRRPVPAAAPGAARPAAGGRRRAAAARAAGRAGRAASSRSPAAAGPRCRSRSCAEADAEALRAELLARAAGAAAPGRAVPAAGAARGGRRIAPTAARRCPPCRSRWRPSARSTSCRWVGWSARRCGPASVPCCCWSSRARSRWPSRPGTSAPRSCCSRPLFGAVGVRVEPVQPGRQLPRRDLARRHPAAARADRGARADRAARPRAGDPARAGPAVARAGLVARRDQRRRATARATSSSGTPCCYPVGHARRGDDRALARAAGPRGRRTRGAGRRRAVRHGTPTAASRPRRAARAGSTRSAGGGTACASPTARWSPRSGRIWRSVDVVPHERTQSLGARAGPAPAPARAGVVRPALDARARSPRASTHLDAGVARRPARRAGRARADRPRGRRRRSSGCAPSERDPRRPEPTTRRRPSATGTRPPRSDA